jgi:hypothetical protein
VSRLQVVAASIVVASVGLVVVIGMLALSALMWPI